jgi:hypothetical protein
LAYFNYPNPHITVHRSPSCVEIQKMHKPGQRHATIDIGSFSTELRRFEAGHYRFASHAGQNDMWLTLDLADPDLEQAVLELVRKILARRYKPFGGVVIPFPHC